MIGVPDFGDFPAVDHLSGLFRPGNVAVVFYRNLPASRYGSWTPFDYSDFDADWSQNPGDVFFANYPAAGHHVDPVIFDGYRSGPADVGPVFGFGSVVPPCLCLRSIFSRFGPTVPPWTQY